MLINRFMFVVLFITPLQLCAGYDVEAIKERVTKQDLFQVKAWQLSNEGWQAVSALQGAVLKVGEKKTEYILPFINLRQKNTAETQCTALAMLGLAPSNEKERLVVENAITASIQRHVLKYTDLNGVRFTITARQVGPVVQLFCDLRSVI